ncbi:MAG: hypothetical protein ACXVYW_05730, partial [Oryzihumus sp.]
MRRSALLARAAVTVAWVAVAGSPSHPGLGRLAMETLSLLPLGIGAVIAAVSIAGRLVDTAPARGSLLLWLQSTSAAALAVVGAWALNHPFLLVLSGGAPRADVGAILHGAAELLPVALAVAAAAFAPVLRRATVLRLRRRSRRAVAVAVAVAVAGWLAAGTAPASAVPAAAPEAAPSGTSVCPPSARTIVYDLAAMALDIPLNGWGDHLPEGLMYALKGSDARVGERQLYANPQLAQPLVIRANVGDCVKVVLRNELPASYPPEPEPTVVKPGDANVPHGATATPPQRVGIHPDGLVQFDPTDSDGARVGGNPDTTVGRGQERTYTWYADHEGQAPLVDVAN